jgi:DNA (cytosine-5)-methyltransferase 1
MGGWVNELHLFAGAGGGILGGELLGHKCVCAVEIEEYPRRVLLQRQRDGMLPKFPIWDDIRTFNGEQWKGIVDIVCGGFPCQDISVAGKGKGIEGKKSSLWGEMGRVIGEIRPKFAFMENSPALTSRGLGRVLGDLAEMGYNARWCVLGAGHVGATHARERIWILAWNPDLLNVEGGFKNKIQGFKGFQRELPTGVVQRIGELPAVFEPKLERRFNGIPSQVDRLVASGNAQFPRVASTAFNILSQGLI